MITLGYHCNITFLNQNINIKKETGVFEWFECRKLQYITDLINTLCVNTSINNVVRGKDKHIYLINPMFFSHHYDLEEYKKIFQRRYNRFLNILYNQKIIYFIRLNPLNCFTTKIEIENFLKAIRKINPNIKIKFLLIDTLLNEKDLNPIQLNNDLFELHHKYFLQSDVNDIYMRKQTIIFDKYKKILQEIGYDINDISKYQFTDKSIV